MIVEDVARREGSVTSDLQPGEPVTIRVRARAEKDLEDPVVGVLIRNRLGIDVFGTNTRIERVDLGRVAAGETFEVEFTFDCLADPPRLYTDGCHAISGRLQPGLAG